MSLIDLFLKSLAGFTAGVVANDVIKIREQNKIAASNGEGVPKKQISEAFTSIVQQPKLMRILIGTVALVAVAILFMSRVQRRKLFK